MPEPGFQTLEMIDPYTAQLWRHGINLSYRAEGVGVTEPHEVRYVKVFGGSPEERRLEDMVVAVSVGTGPERAHAARECENLITALTETLRAPDSATWVAFYTDDSHVTPPAPLSRIEPKWLEHREGPVAVASTWRPVRPAEALLYQRLGLVPTPRRSATLFPWHMVGSLHLQSALSHVRYLADHALGEPRAFGGADDWRRVQDICAAAGAPSEEAETMWWGGGWRSADLLGQAPIGWIIGWLEDKEGRFWSPIYRNVDGSFAWRYDKVPLPDSVRIVSWRLPPPPGSPWPVTSPTSTEGSQT